MNRTYKRKESMMRLDGQVFIDRLNRDQRPYDRTMASRITRFGISIYAADRWAIKYGYHPYEIWGAAFYEGCEYEPTITV